MKNRMIQELNKGFSLVELLISVAILAIAIIGVIGVFPQGINQVTMAGQISTINHLGQAKLDELRAASWNSKLLLEGTHPSTQIETHFSPCPNYCNDAADIETHNNFAVVPSGYSRAWRVDTSGDGLRRTVRVTVGYLVYDDAGNVLPAPTIKSGPRAIHERSSEFTTIVTSP